MNIRQPVRAGTFYESSAPSCRRHALKLLDLADPPPDLPRPLYGGLVPHAGWMFSGRLAARTIRALAAERPGTIVLFGADHVGTARLGEVYDSGVWRTPLGDVEVDADLAAALIAAGTDLRSNPPAHDHEHSLEVQIPLLREALPDVKILPIAVPPLPIAVQIGETVGKLLREQHPTARVLGSTDLTHHGGHFGSPGGRGEQSEAYTRVNDRRILDRIEALDAEAIVPEAQQHMNACGGGAIAATLAAVRALGAERGIVLEYTNSYKVVHELYPADPDDTTVGYASVVFA